MNNKLSSRTIAIYNIDGDIGILTQQKRLKKDTTLRKQILIEKLNLLYTIDVISIELYYSYMETINSL